jgi:hypothetical protein
VIVCIGSQRWAANHSSVGPHAGGVSLVYGLMENK